MFGSAILDVAIGLAFLFFLFSTIASHINEFVARAFRWRSKDLEEGLQWLLGDDNLVHDVLSHRLTGGLQKLEDQISHSTIADVLHSGLGPSYIDAHGFALALFDTLIPSAGQTSPPTFATLRELTRQLSPDNVPVELRNTLLTIIDNADGTVAGARKGVEDWFNAAMERLSGVYRRRLMTVNLITGLCLTLILGFDTIAIAMTLWQDQAVRAVVAGAGQQASGSGIEDAFAALAQLNLPLGWSSRPADLNGWLLKIAGLAVSTFAISFGGPFWFDILKRVSNLRAAGPSPKTPETRN